MDGIIPGGDLVEVGPITRADWGDRATGGKIFLGPGPGGANLDLFVGGENCPPLVEISLVSLSFVKFRFFQKVAQRRRCCFLRVFCLFWPKKDLRFVAGILTPQKQSKYMALGRFAEGFDRVYYTGLPVPYFWFSKSISLTKRYKKGYHANLTKRHIKRW